MRNGISTSLISVVTPATGRLIDSDPLAFASWVLFDDANTLSPLVTSTRSGTATFFNSTGTLQSAAANTPRVSYDPANLSLGPFLLAEEQRTNSIRNNTMQGAVAGTPGTLPTNWSFVAGTTGIASEIVGTGTVNGIAYIDIRYSGTAAATSSFSQRFETGTSIAALTGQTWAMSTWAKVQAGSTNGITAINHQYVENTNVGGFVTSGGIAITVDSNFNRQTTSRTLTGGATVAFLSGGISVTVTSGQAIDITLRIGLPQLEQGARASSPILTYGTAVTRSADNLQVTNLAATGFNATEGTLYADFQHDSTSSFPTVLALNNGTVQNRMVIVASTSTGNRGAVANANVSQADMNLPNYTLNTRSRAVLAFATDNFGFSANGAVPLRDTLGSVPSVTQLELGRQTGGLDRMNGRVFNAAIIPRRISDAALQNVTKL